MHNFEKLIFGQKSISLAKEIYIACKELSSEIAKANEYANEAQDAKKAGKPHNIGAVLFFLPGLGFCPLHEAHPGIDIFLPEGASQNNRSLNNSL